jgi:hypothetical protein
VGGAAAGNPVTLTASGSSSTATYTTSFTTSGVYTITAAYSGDTTNAASTGTLSETVAAVAQSFSLAATNSTIAQGSSGTSTVTVTPGGGYTGTVAFTIAGPSTLEDTCYTLGSASITSNAAVTTTLTINTTEAACTTAGARHFASISGPGNKPPAGWPFGTRTAIALALFPFATAAGFRRRRWYGKAFALCFAALTLAALSACGGSSSTTPEEAAKGTYTLTITGTDSAANISNSTTMTLTID